MDTSTAKRISQENAVVSGIGHRLFHFVVDFSVAASLDRDYSEFCDVCADDIQLVVVSRNHFREKIKDAISNIRQWHFSVSVDQLKSRR
jgi:hypothetical protein